LYWSPRVRLLGTGHVACMGEKRNALRVLVRKPVGKRPLGRHRRRREYVNWISEKLNGRRGLDSFVSGQGQVADCCVHGNERKGFTKCVNLPS